MVMAVIIIPRAEMVVYLRMTGLTINTDKRFFAWLIFELATAIVIFFFYIRKGTGVLKRDEPGAD